MWGEKILSALCALYEPVELYDRGADSLELHDLAADS